MPNVDNGLNAQRTSLSPSLLLVYAVLILKGIRPQKSDIPEGMPLLLKPGTP
jgi:hypothetical protein